MMNDKNSWSQKWIKYKLLISGSEKEVLVPSKTCPALTTKSKLIQA